MSRFGPSRVGARLQVCGLRGQHDLSAGVAAVVYVKRASE